MATISYTAEAQLYPFQNLVSREVDFYKKIQVYHKKCTKICNFLITFWSAL